MGDQPFGVITTPAFRVIVTRAFRVITMARARSSRTLARYLAPRFLAMIGVFALLAIPSPAAGAQQQNRQTTPRKVWTNEDVQRLKENDAISIVGLGPDEFDVDEPAPTAQGAKQKVWTNEDLEKLRNPDTLSIVPSAEQAPAEPGTPAAAAPAAEAPEAAPAKAPYDRFSDPAWYAEQAFDLHVQLAQHEAALYQYLENVALARDAVTQPGVGFFEGDEGITLEAGVQNLELQVREIEIELEKLSDLARRNGIAPGMLRG